MTSEEFLKWLKAAQSSFVGVDKYLKELADDDRLRVQRRWLKILADVPYDVADEALTWIGSDPSRFPRSWSYLPSEIMKFAGTVRPRRSESTVENVKCRCRRCDREFMPAKVCPSCKSGDWEYAYHCLTCLDSGIAMVWSPETMHRWTAQMRDEETEGWTDPEPKPSNRTTVRCSCEAGRSKTWLPTVFDPTSMVPIEPIDTATERLKAKLEDVLGIGGGRLNEFDGFNAGATT